MIFVIDKNFSKDLKFLVPEHRLMINSLMYQELIYAEKDHFEKSQ